MRRGRSGDGGRIDGERAVLPFLESETRVYKKWSDGVRRATTFCRMSAGGDELFWREVSGTLASHRPIGVAMGS